MRVAEEISSFAPRQKAAREGIEPSPLGFQASAHTNYELPGQRRVTEGGRTLTSRFTALRAVPLHYSHHKTKYG